jgi:hypothetical protein
MAQNQNDNRLYALLAVLALALIGFFAYIYNGDEGWKWGESYEQDDKNPYGLYVMRQLMAAYFPKGQLRKIGTTVAKDLPIKTTEPTNYVFMGATPYYDSSDVVRLTAFVRKGNTAMLLTKDLPKQLSDSILKPYRSAAFLSEQAREAAEAKKEAEKLKETIAEGEGGFGEIAPEIEPDGSDRTASNTNTYPDIDTTKENEEFVDDDVSNVDIDSLIAVREESGDNNIVIEDDNAENEDAENSVVAEEYLTPSAYNRNRLFVTEKTDTTALMSLTNNSGAGTKFIHYFRKKAEPYTWESLNLDLFTDATDGNITVLGKIDNKKPNFIKIKYGAGYFYLHSNPLAFTNYYLVKEDSKNYAEQVLNYLPNGTTWWDEPSKTYRPSNDEDAWHPEIAMDYKGPFDFVLSQPALRWAWYLTWAMVAFFLLFRAKRRQRMIPVNEPNINSSLQFVQNIGRLYFLQNNHKQLGEQKMKFFLHTLRHRFGLPTHLPKEQLIPRIVQKTGIAEDYVKAIFSQADYMQYTGDVKTEDLIDLHNALDVFYKKINVTA